MTHLIEPILLDTWELWEDMPPQLPSAPIFIIGRERVLITSILRLSELPGRKSWTQKLRWAPTGIYREEFYRVTNRWE